MANPSPNKDNLIVIRSEEEARKKGSAGGKKSGETRRKQKLLKDTLLAYLKAKIDGKTVQDGITEALIEKALSGDTKAYEVIRDTIGQKPIDKQQQAVDSKVEIVWRE